MLIIIKSQENGWDTERKIEIPEDEKLVKCILRSVKRRVSSPKDQEENLQEKEEDREEKELVKQDENTVFETGVRGFLLIRCPACGRQYAFNAKDPRISTMCKSCRHEIILEDLAVAELYCPACKRTWRYRTNIEEAEIKCGCIECGSEMIGQWDSKLKRYIPKK